MRPDGLEPGATFASLSTHASALCESAPLGIVVASLSSHQLVYANPAAARMFDYPLEKMRALRIDDLWAPGAPNQVFAELAVSIEGTPRYATGVRCRRADGSVFFAAISEIRLDVAGERCLVGYFSPAPADTKEGEDLFRRLVEGAPEAIFVQTRGRIAYVNSAACAHFGAASEEELLGTDLMERIHPDFRDEVTRRIARVNAERLANPTLELVHLKLDGTAVPVEVSAVPLEFNGDPGALVFVRNTAERKRAEEAVRTAQRLESIGVLAGGIAHDFNNLLTGIFGNLDVARYRLQRGQGEQALSALTSVMGVLDRARSLTRQLLTFSRGGSPLRKPVDLGRSIQATARFSLAGSNIQSRFALEPELWWCHADENQIAQVLDNLVINACQAMPRGGMLEVRACNQRLASGEHATLPAGPYLRIEVSDTGVGIPPEIIDQVFDPFFSTKGQGNGLGLATAYSIIQRHHGAIEVKSTFGHGTTFHLYIPALPEHSAEMAEEPSSQFRGQGEILVLDDEHFIVDLITEMVRGMGFSVRAASNAEEALQTMSQAQASGAPIPIAILDLTVPGGKGGREVAGALRLINPKVKLIVSSGYSEDPIMADPERYGFDARLAKPYALRELQAVLRHVTT